MDIQFGTEAEFLDGVPGIYKNIRERIYHDVPIHVGSKSRCNTAYEKNPKRVLFDHERRDQPKSDDTLLGNAAHAYILEPDEFDRNYAVFHGERRSNRDKERYNEMVVKYGANYVIRTKHVTQCEAMREAVMDHAGARSFFQEPGLRELTLLWIDEPTGLLMKCRIDIYPFERQVITDLKTSKASYQSEFSRTIGTWRYDEQGAIYMKGAETLGLPAKGVAFLAVEKTEPYDVYSYRLVPSAIRAAWASARVKIDRYAECVKNDHWPGPPQNIIDIDVPEWRKREIDRMFELTG